MALYTDCSHRYNATQLPLGVTAAMTTTYRAGGDWSIVEFEDALADGLARMLRDSDAAWPGGLRGSAVATAATVRRSHYHTQHIADMVAIADGEVAGTCVLQVRSDRADTAGWPAPRREAGDSATCGRRWPR